MAQRGSFLLQHLARTLTGLGLPLLTRLDNDRMMWRVFRINVGIKWSIKLKLVYILTRKCSIVDVFLVMGMITYLVIL